MLISFHNVGKSFRGVKVLDGVSFNVHEGECMAVLGRSGCGKSTLLKILMGIYSADAGKVSYRNRHIDLKELRNKVGYTSQENSFYDTLSCEENLDYYASRYGIRLDKHRAHELLASVRLERMARLPAGMLSGGQKRRLDFAISLVHDPDILILDEPTTGLDPMLVEDFWKTVNDMLAKEKTVIVVTHHLDDVERHCDKAAILKDGKVSALLDDTKDIESEFRRFA